MTLDITTTDGLKRTYALYLPSGYSAQKKKYPLVVLLHGGSGTGEAMLAQSQFAAKADAEGFIVVAPDGYNGQWNDGSGIYNANIDDVSFITQLVAKLQGQLSVDVSRMFVTGFSEGGQLTEMIGMSTTGIFAAIGPVAGQIAVNIAAKYKPGPLPVITIKGGADPRQPIGGGKTANGAEVMSQAWTVQFWVDANQCAPDPVSKSIPPTVQDGTSVTENGYFDRAKKLQVLYYLVAGMGHAWPPAAGVYPVSLVGPTSGNLNATDLIWGFFSGRVLGFK